MHDRDIAVPCEDSVLTVEAGAVQPIRRSRGYAPLPVLLGGPSPSVLAVGAEVKNTFCLTRQEFAFCSGHLGDMGTLESRRAFETAVAQMSALHDVRPELVVADEHPGTRPELGGGLQCPHRSPARDRATPPRARRGPRR